MLPLAIRSFNCCTITTLPSTFQTYPEFDDVVTQFCLDFLEFRKLRECSTPKARGRYVPAYQPLLGRPKMALIFVCDATVAGAKKTEDVELFSKSSANFIKLIFTNAHDIISHETGDSDLSIQISCFLKKYEITRTIMN